MDSPELNPAPPAQEELEQRRSLLASTVRNGIAWLYWIIGMSVLNTLLIRIGAKLQLVFGLGTTRFVDGFSVSLAEHSAAGDSAYILVGACLIDALIVGGLALAAKFAQRGQRWPLLGVLVFYALDALFFVWPWRPYPLLFHGLALVALGRAFWALVGLSRLPQGGPATEPSAPDPYAPSSPPELLMLLMGGIPNLEEPDPDEPARTGLFRNVTGLPALIIGLVIIGVLLAGAAAPSKY